MKDSILKTKSYKMALDSVNICKSLIKNQEYILSKQFVRSSTSVGANIREAQYAQSTKDFIHKLSISLKECDETLYWLDLLKDSNYLTKYDFETLSEQAIELKRMLISSIITSKNKLKTNN